KPTRPVQQQRHTPVRHLITLLLQRPDLAQLVENLQSLNDIDLPGADLLTDLLTFLHDRPGTHTGTILEHWRDHEHGKHLAKLAQATLDLEEHRLEAEFQDTLGQLDRYRSCHPKQIRAKLIRGETLTEEEKLILKQEAQSQSERPDGP
ncbi:MAG: hypothetical protein ACPG1A_16830, partial [Halioglobus sp.]